MRFPFRTQITWIIGILFFSLSIAQAFNEPAVNLDATTFLDGGYAPGLYFVQYNMYIQGNKAVDHNGDEIPGGSRLSIFAQLNQLFYTSPVKVLGAYLCADFLLPYVAPTSEGSLGAVPVVSNTAGIGDLITGPALQWMDTKFMGKPFLHRLELDVHLPVGKYDSTVLVSPGANFISWEPYYAFTWMFADKWETSWRLHYVVNGQNDVTGIKPGQMFHVNYAVSREVTSKLRLGAAGYLLQQLTEDQTNGVDGTNTKEQAIALGPGLVYNGGTFNVILSHPIEFQARNRFQGSRTTMQLIHRF